MALFDIEKSSLDKTVKIFDGFYNNALVVNSNQYDIIKSYFTSVCDTETIANNFTSIIFRIAQESDVDALSLLDEIKGTANNKIELTQIMAYYLNSSKSKTSLYGVAIIPRPNQPVARNIVL
jgi:N-acetylglucosamine kinase-like BadF-type ATPase